MEFHLDWGNGFSLEVPLSFLEVLVKACKALADDRMKVASQSLSRERLKEVAPDLSFESTLEGLVRIELKEEGGIIYPTFFFTRWGRKADRRESYLDCVFLRIEKGELVVETISYGLGPREYD